MNTNLTELIFVLDRSGSMADLAEDTIGGYNSMIEKQKNEQGDAIVTTVLFDDKYEMLYNGIDVQKIEPLTNKQYYARGMTALLDAVGKTIAAIDEKYSKLPDSMIPEKTLFVITTDGMENASREFQTGGIKAMIEAHKEKGWEFIFLGANIDAVKVGGSMGISADRSVSYKADKAGTAANFMTMNCVASAVRGRRDIDKDWKANIEQHNK
ncbi:MAG: VWA domain-containing protein [Clostridia bacterium]|nr:VWA domain-containing protein [Clostridia bacterium]